MNRRYRFAVMILFFDCENFILRAIENCAPFVEKIYVLYSELPYGKYNPDARNIFKNVSNKEILKESKYFDKIDLIVGDWHTEEEQRNECLMKAKNEGFDYLIVQDADEFYLPKVYKENLIEIINNPHYSFYRNPWYIFWKDTKHIIINNHYYYQQNKDLINYKQKSEINYNANFAVNCKRDVLFREKRQVNADDYFMLSGICYHLSFVLNDEQMKRKILTWSHSNQVDFEFWYKYKWLAWNENTKYLNPITSVEYYKAVKLEETLPKELEDFKVGVQERINLTPTESMIEFLHDLILLIKTKYWSLKSFLSIRIKH